MDYETMLKKYQQEQQLRFVVRAWKKQGGERQAKLLMLINDYDKEISPHFTLLTPEDRMRIFHDEYPETERRFHYQTSHERLEFHEVGMRNGSSTCTGKISSTSPRKVKGGLPGMVNAGKRTMIRSRSFGSPRMLLIA
jgi:hypothetical protein